MDHPLHRVSVENNRSGLIATLILCKTRAVDRRLPDEPLTQPTRAELFALLEKARRPLGSETLAEKLGLHVNGVRRHLEQLQDAGLVERAKVRGGRGRPRDQWSIAATAAPGGSRPEAYRDLAGWLTRTLDSGRSGQRQIERSGREIGQELALDAKPSAESFGAALSALGFQPELQVDEQGTARCRLCNCPYRDAVVESAEVVCTLHRGMTAGLVDALAPGGSLTVFNPHDPDRAGCEIVVEGTSWQREEAGGSG
jgi:predicted ArsR family transcriptional regulator